MKSNAFASAAAVTNVYYAGTASQWASIAISSNSANPMGSNSTSGAALYLNGNTEMAATDIEITGITEIKAYTFARCNSITSVKIGDDVTTIGNFAFYYCTGLTDVVIGSGLVTVNNYAFGGCSVLTKVYYNGTSEYKAEKLTGISETGTTYFINATWYYFSEKQPTDTEGNYWHYVENVPTAWVVETSDDGDSGTE